MIDADHVALHTRDGVWLAADHHQPAQGADPGLAVVVCHGFTMHARRDSVVRIATAFTGIGGVVVADFRGHGRSAGRSTLGDREAYDVDAAVRWARRRGYRRVATVGFSMGGAAVLRQAGTLAFADERSRVDAVVSVSAPSRWFLTESARLRLVAWGVRTPTSRLATRFMYRTRVTGDFVDIGPQPLDVIAAIPPVPLLVVHGGRDSWLGANHGADLTGAAGQGAELWFEPQYGHAEEALGPELTGRIVKWVATSAARAPDAPSSP